MKQKYDTQDDYTEEQYKKDRESARESYDATIAEANKVAGDTIAILQKGYASRADALKNGTESLKVANKQEEDENNLHNQKLKIFGVCSIVHSPLYLVKMGCVPSRS